MFGVLLLVQVDLDPIIVVVRLSTRNLQDCPGEIDHTVRREGIVVTLGDLWSTHDKRNVDVFLVAESLSGVPSVGAERVAVVGGVEDVGVVKLPSLFEPFDDGFD